MKIDVLIIGGGPTGLSIGYFLKKENRDFIILEREDRVGGISKSIKLNGSIFDLGGHSFHTPYQEVEEFVKSLLPLDGLERDARVLFKDTMIPYPFQKFFYLLPYSEIVRECEVGLKNKKEKYKNFSNFYEYILHTFGDGISKYFMLPYNQKLWGRNLKNISIEWVNERVAAPKGVQEEFKKDGKRRPLQPKMVVYYPRKGGFEEIFISMSKSFKDKILVNETVEYVDLKQKFVVTSKKRKIYWNLLVSTMPLIDFIDIIFGISDFEKDHLSRLSNDLEYLSLRLDFFVIRGRPYSSLQRIYSADFKIPPHKIAFNHNSSNYLKRMPNEAIIMETSFSKEKPLPEDINVKLINTLKAIKAIATESDIIYHEHQFLKYAYPVYTRKRVTALGMIRKILKNYNVFTVGRFGGWEYINSDKCIKIGMNFVKSLK